MVKVWFISAAIFGFLSVPLGAFGVHSLKNVLDTQNGKAKPWKQVGGCLCVTILLDRRTKYVD